ncbi:MAG: hypothetical protein LBI29_01070 [Rickettsiales bacterium]|nr:hypothetical protein [Rickettsiales bacterium]
MTGVIRGANSTNIIFSDNRPPREIVQGKTASFGVRAVRYAGDCLDFISSFFSSRPALENYSESGVGDGVFYYSLSTTRKMALAGLGMGIITSVAELLSYPVHDTEFFEISAKNSKSDRVYSEINEMRSKLPGSAESVGLSMRQPNYEFIGKPYDSLLEGSPVSMKEFSSKIHSDPEGSTNLFEISETFSVTTGGRLSYMLGSLFIAIVIAGVTYYEYKKYKETYWGIDIQPDGTTKFGYFKSRKEGLDGKGTVLWPNGVGYEGLFENNRIKNNPNGKLILFPEEDRYTVEFPNTRISGKENEKYTFADTYHFNNISYNSVDKSLTFADGDVFRGVLSKNAEGIYISSDGTVVRDTLRNVLLKKAEDEKEKEKALSTAKVNSSESIDEEMNDYCTNPDDQEEYCCERFSYMYK